MKYHGYSYNVYRKTLKKKNIGPTKGNTKQNQQLLSGGTNTNSLSLCLFSLPYKMANQPLFFNKWTTLLRLPTFSSSNLSFCQLSFSFSDSHQANPFSLSPVTFYKAKGEAFRCCQRGSLLKQ